MISKVDWVSFTVPMTGEGKTELQGVWQWALVNLVKLSPAVYDLLFANERYDAIRARAPYARAMQREDGGVAIFMSAERKEALVEVSGKGCQWLYAAGTMKQLLREAQATATRIDIACDILTDIEPSMFAVDRKVLRSKSHSEFVSTTGETCYVGSRRSDRYARVYRYYPPHPRSHLLRVEHVLKSEQAKTTIVQLLEEGTETIVAKLGNVFGWQHPVWTPEVITDEKLVAWKPERRNASTVRWVFAQCVPAIRRLIADGTLSSDEVMYAITKEEIDELVKEVYP